MSRELHRRKHHVSHFQVVLLNCDRLGEYPESTNGEAFVAFGAAGVAVSTAWDHNGTTEPLVEISVSGFGPRAATPDGMKVIAEAPFAVGGKGIAVGNWVAGDVANIAVAPGRYTLIVLADTWETFKARRVAFHLLRTGEPPP